MVIPRVKYIQIQWWQYINVIVHIGNSTIGNWLYKYLYRHI